jgi:hypothetical protein
MFYEAQNRLQVEIESKDRRKSERKVAANEVFPAAEERPLLCR